MSEYSFRECREYSEGDELCPATPVRHQVTPLQEELINAQGWGDREEVARLQALGVTFPESASTQIADSSVVSTLLEEPEHLTTDEINKRAWARSFPEGLPDLPQQEN